MQTSPRMLSVVEGISEATIVVSETTITSLASRSRSRSSRSSKWGLPNSSSPSIKNFKLTGNAPISPSKPRTASVCMRTWPLSSEEPRAKSWPSDDDGFERRGGPLVERVDGLDVVVAVYEHCGRPRACPQPLTINRRGRAGAVRRSRVCCDDLHLVEPGLPQQPGAELRRVGDVTGVGRVGGN